MNFDDVYSKLFDKIYNFIYQRTINLSETEDLVSEVFTAAWQNWDKYDPQVPVSRWVFGIAAHKLNDHLRKKYKLHEVEINIDNYSEYEEQSSDISLVKNKYRRILVSLVYQLKSTEQRFINLRYEQNMTLAEVAKELNISVNNAKVTQNRLVKKLKLLWKNNG